MYKATTSPVATMLDQVHDRFPLASRGLRVCSVPNDTFQVVYVSCQLAEITTPIVVEGRGLLKEVGFYHHGVDCRFGT